MSQARKISFLLTIMLVTSGLSGYVSASEPIVDDVDAQARSIINTGLADPKTEAVANSANDFAFKLSGAVCEGKESENFVFSPFSVWLPMAALLNGVEPASKPNAVRAFTESDVTISDVNRAAGRMIFDLTGENGLHPPEHNSGRLKIANALFVDESINSFGGFSHIFAEDYYGKAAGVDFGSDVAVKSINNWVKNCTDGHIDKAVTGFDPKTTAVLVNAIYVSDRWAIEFDKSKSEKGVFHSPGGDKQAVFMRREISQRYYEDGSVQATSLRFENGGGLMILLPKTGSAAEYLAGMTGDSFRSILSGGIFEEVVTILPRFKIETDLPDLKNTLETLRLPQFNGTPLTGILRDADPLQINEVLHKAVIEVDETGVTAAAAAINEMGPLAGQPEDNLPKIMLCDRPFVFILYHHTADAGEQVLFTGIVNQPDQNL